MSSTVPIVCVVDDDLLVRESLECLIRSAGWEPETHSSAAGFLTRDQSAATPSCLVLDVALPDLGGLELQRRIGGDRTDLPIIFITGHGDIPTSVQAIRAGALEFLTKPVRNEVLLEAIRNGIERSRAARGEYVRRQAIRECYAALTRREREVMALVVAGMSNKRVGRSLGISEITVKAHRGKVMRKMKAGSLADLVRMATIVS